MTSVAVIVCGTPQGFPSSSLTSTIVSDNHFSHPCHHLQNHHIRPPSKSLPLPSLRLPNKWLPKCESSLTTLTLDRWSPKGHYILTLPVGLSIIVRPRCPDSQKGGIRFIFASGFLILPEGTFSGLRNIRILIFKFICIRD